MVLGVFILGKQIPYLRAKVIFQPSTEYTAFAIATADKQISSHTTCHKSYTDVRLQIGYCPITNYSKTRITRTAGDHQNKFEL